MKEALLMKYYVLGKAFGFDIVVVLREFTNYSAAEHFAREEAPIKWLCDDAYVVSSIPSCY